VAFKKGVSGNPKGKPKGCKDKRTELRAMLEPHAGALIKKAVDLALAGDTTALRICMDRLVAPMKAKDGAVEIGESAGSLTEQGKTVLSALVSGRISPEDATTVMQALSAQARIIEVDQLEQRIAALERQADGTV
jgi:hypothetical protein